MEFWLNWLPVIGTVFLTICYIPQIIQLHKTKETAGMNLIFWLSLDMALLILTMNTYIIFLVHGTWGAFVTETLNLVLALYVTILVFYYRYNPKD